MPLISLSTDKDAMREIGIDVSGAQREDCALHDPAGQPLARVREIPDAVRARVYAFVMGHAL